MTSTMQFRTLPTVSAKITNNKTGYSKIKNPEEPGTLELIVSLATLMKKLNGLTADLEYLYSVVDKHSA